jgi:hypothetical protein
VGTTYVYVSTSVQSDVALSLEDTGPDGTGAKLNKSSVGPRDSNVKVATIPRSQSSGVTHSLEIAFRIGGGYLASLAVLMRGHDFGSMIWWRWRTTQLVAGAWVTDYQSHGTTVSLDGVSYTFRVTGKSTSGYDDIAVEIARP